MEQAEALPRELLERLRRALAQVPPVEAHLVVLLSVDLLLGKLEPTDRALRDKCCELLTTEQRNALEEAMGGPGWAALYETCLETHRAQALEELLTQTFLDALRPAGYLTAEWFGEKRLLRMTTLVLAIAKTVAQAGPDITVAVVSQLMRDDQDRPRTQVVPIYCAACAETASRSGRRRSVRLASVQLRGSGAVLVYQPLMAPTGDALRIKREHRLPPPVGLLPAQVHRLTDPSWETVQLRCPRAHEGTLNRRALLAKAERTFSDTLPRRYLGT